MAKLGRPEKLTPEVQEAIANALKRGCFMETASAAAGISRETLYSWLRRGASEKTGIYKDFSDMVKKAIAEGEIDILSRIESATAWQAAAWRLERRFPSRWGRPRLQKEIVVNTPPSEALDLSVLTDEELTFLDHLENTEENAVTKEERSELVRIERKLGIQLF